MRNLESADQLIRALKLPVGEIDQEYETGRLIVHRAGYVTSHPTRFRSGVVPEDAVNARRIVVGYFVRGDERPTVSAKDRARKVVAITKLARALRKVGVRGLRVAASGLTLAFDA